MQRKPDPINSAMRIAAEHFGVSVADIRSQRRSKDVHAARTWGMYLACDTTGASFEEVAKRFRRDHMFVRAVARGRAHDVAINEVSATFFDTLKARIQGPC